MRAGEGRRLASRTERGRISSYFDVAPGAEIRRVEEPAPPEAAELSRGRLARLAMGCGRPGDAASIKASHRSILRGDVGSFPDLGSEDGLRRSAALLRRSAALLHQAAVRGSTPLSLQTPFSHIIRNRKHDPANHRPNQKKCHSNNEPENRSPQSKGMV